MLALSHEVPAVVVGLGAGVIVHEDLVQSLQGQEAFILLSGGIVGLGPFLGNEGVQNAGLDHLGLDLVTVLNEGHGKGAGILQRVRGELIEDLVVLGLLPIKLHGVIGVDGLQVLNEQGKGALAAAGVAHAVEGLSVGLLDSLFGQFLQGHALGLLNDLLSLGELCGSFGAGAGPGSAGIVGLTAGHQT